METYAIMARMRVDVNRAVRANSLEEALTLAATLTVKDFVQSAKGADCCFNDWTDFEVYGVFKE